MKKTKVRVVQLANQDRDMVADVGSFDPGQDSGTLQLERTSKVPLGEDVVNWRVSPEEWLPSHWTNAINTPVSVARKGLEGKTLPSDAIGYYSSPPGSIALSREWNTGTYNPTGIKGALEKLVGWDMPGSVKTKPPVPHEYAHAAWTHDLTDQERSDWTNLHNNTLAADKADQTGNTKVPRSISVMKDDPSHSFAYSFQDYVVDPWTMYKDHPDMYNYFWRVTGGKDYSRPYVKPPDLTPPERLKDQSNLPPSMRRK
jgi:hypothetical protein